MERNVSLISQELNILDWCSVIRAFPLTQGKLKVSSRLNPLKLFPKSEVYWHDELFISLYSRLPNFVRTIATDTNYIKWSEEQENAFLKLKQKLTSKTVMAY